MTHPTDIPSQRALRWTAPLLALALLVVAGCSDEALLPPEPEAGDMFARYVAIGNSITAGFQSNGISGNTQEESYAVLLANQMGTSFNIPRMTPPGCPPPWTRVFPTPQRVNNLPDDACALRADDPPPPVLNNVAVPGAEVIDVLDNQNPASNANALTTFILGGRTQIEAAADADPTFVSVWIGNNDVLGAALAGDTDRITPTEAFESRYSDMMSQLDDIGPEGGVLIGVANVTLIPHLSPGAAFAQAEPQLQQLAPSFEVADNCSGSGAASLIPFRYSFGTLLPQALAGQEVTLDCLNAAPVLTPEEVATLDSTVRAFNAFIQQQAEARGWAFVNPNDLFAQPELRAQLPPFPDINPLNDTPAFGPLFSLDGVHPSAQSHRLVTDAVIDAINETYGTSIPALSP